MLHTLIMARLMTELILDGYSAIVDIEQFRLGPFHTGKLLETTHLL
jgi:hypothetical protein